MSERKALRSLRHWQRLMRINFHVCGVLACWNLLQAEMVMFAVNAACAYFTQLNIRRMDKTAQRIQGNQDMQAEIKNLTDMVTGACWFGESWGAAVCDTASHTHTPVGKACAHCGEVFEHGDKGITNHQGYAWHLDCHARLFIGGANHIRGNCICCGGTEEPDPPGLSKREAARLAVAEYEKQMTGGVQDGAS